MKILAFIPDFGAAKANARQRGERRRALPGLSGTGILRRDDLDGALCGYRRRGSRPTRNLTHLDGGPVTGGGTERCRFSTDEAFAGSLSTCP